MQGAAVRSVRGLMQGYRRRLSPVMFSGERQPSEHALHIAVQLRPCGVPPLELHNEFAERSGHHPQDEQHHDSAQGDIGGHQPDCPRIAHTAPPNSSARNRSIHSMTAGMAASTSRCMLPPTVVQSAASTARMTHCAGAGRPRLRATASTSNMPREWDETPGAGRTACSKSEESTRLNSSHLGISYAV